MIWLLVSVVVAQELIIKGFVDQVPELPPFSFKRGGDDWPEICRTGNYLSPVDLSSEQRVSSSNSSFRPILANLPFVAATELEQVEYANMTAWEVYATSLWETSGPFTLRHTLATVQLTTPSAHAIEGERFPLGINLIYVLRHPDRDVLFSLLVEVLFREGRRSRMLDSLVTGQGVDFSELYPASGIIDDYFSYIGSELLPTPNCREPITWVIPNYFPEASREQIQRWSSRYMSQDFSNGRGNVKNLQDLGRRTIYRYVSINEETMTSFLREE